MTTSEHARAMVPPGIILIWLAAIVHAGRGWPRWLALLLGAIALTAPALAADGERRAFTMPDLPLEGGAHLPNATVMYATWGKLDAARDNAVLLPSHYMADAHGYNWLIGPGKALDPARYYLVATELFGNGKSSSPSNTPEPLHGPRFPAITIRDNVEATRRLLEDGLGVHHLRAVVGFSMGGQQAFQWAVSHPAFMDRVVVTAATARTWPHGQVRLEGQIMAITNDPAFRGGDYQEQPRRGLETFGAVWAGWLFSQGWWREELWRADAKPGATWRTVFEGLWRDFIPGADANDLILQMRSWEAHDVGTTPGFGGDLAHALGAIRAAVLYMPSTSDLYFPLDDAKVEAPLIPHAVLLPIPSLWGHTAGAGGSPADARFLNDHIGRFVATGRP